MKKAGGKTFSPIIKAAKINTNHHDNIMYIYKVYICTYLQAKETSWFV